MKNWRFDIIEPSWDGVKANVVSYHIPGYCLGAIWPQGVNDSWKKHKVPGNYPNISQHRVWTYRVFWEICCRVFHFLGYLQPCAGEARLAEYKAQVAAAEAQSLLAVTPYSKTLGTLAPPLGTTSAICWDMLGCSLWELCSQMFHFVSRRPSLCMNKQLPFLLKDGHIGHIGSKGW